MKNIPTPQRILDIRRKRHMRRLRLFILFSILFISIIIGLSYLSGNHRVVINNVVVTGTHIINNSDIQTTALNDLSGKYFGLFTKADALIYPKKRIYKDLILKYPRIKTLSVYRDNWHTLHIGIEERSGSSLYCGQKVPNISANIGEDCYFINDDGYIFDKAPYFSGNIYFKYYAPLQSNNENPLGQSILPPERFHSIEQFIDGVTGLGFKPSYLVIDPNTDDTLYLDHKQTDTSPTIIFNDSSTLKTILGNLSISMNQPGFSSQINSKYSTLLYIDLRFDNKVLYKFK